MTSPNPPASTGKRRASGERFGEFGVRWLALPPVGSGLRRNLCDVRPLFRLTPARPRRLWSSRTLSQSPSPTKARTIGPTRQGGILEDLRAGHRGLRYPERLGGEKRSGALKNQGKLELWDLEMVACLSGRVRGEIVFGEGAVGDAWSACAPSELSESMVLGTASPGWRLNACVPSGLWNPCVCVPSGLWNPCVCVPSGLWNP